MTELCGKWMPRAHERCARPKGHSQHCRTASAHANSKAASATWRTVNPERNRELQKAWDKRHIESGENAKRQALFRRRKADERCDNIDPRLESLLGGLIGPSTP